jgi:Sodium:dicarboxylate symporter family
MGEANMASRVDLVNFKDKKTNNRMLVECEVLVHSLTIIAAFSLILSVTLFLLTLFWLFLVALEDYKIVGKFTEGMNVLGLVMFSVILGATIGKMREKGKPIQEFLAALSEAMMIITRWVIW